MLLVHYMGELLSKDELIPASKESERIRPRTETSIVGGGGIPDQTPELLKSLYSEDMMIINEIDAKAAATAAANTSATPTNHIDAQEVPPTPQTTSEAIKAINKLYEKYDKKAEKVKKIIDIKKSFNAGLKSLATLLLEMYTKSFESYTTWKDNGPIYKENTKKNIYIDSDEFNKIKNQFEAALKLFKKSDDFKYIKGKHADAAATAADISETGRVSWGWNFEGDTDCDKIIDDFKPPAWNSMVYTSPENKELLIKICRLFSLYKESLGKIGFYYDYFKKWNKLEGRFLDLHPDQYDVVKQFKLTSNTYLPDMLRNLDNDVKYTEILENELGVKSSALPGPEPAYTGPKSIQEGGGNKRKNVRTRRRAKPVK